MARCPSCEKFVSFEEIEPEMSGLDITEGGQISAEIRIVNACAECGEEMTETTFDVDIQADVGGHEGEGHELSVEEQSLRREQKPGGRYKKSYYGIVLEVTVSCKCEEGLNMDERYEDYCAASHMESLV